MPSLDDPLGAGPDVDPDDDRDGDPGEELEARIEQADHAFGSESFGTTAEEQERGETLDQRLAEERPSKAPLDVEIAVEDPDVPDTPDHESELIANASLEHDAFVAPEDAAISVRDEAPGGVDHRDDEYVALYDESQE